MARLLATTSSARSSGSVCGGTSIPVDAGRAVFVADGVVRDDSWMEVFEAASGLAAIVQASGPYSMPLLAARPGIVPPVHGPPPSHGVDPGLLFLSARTAYKLKVRLYTELDEGNCFARWLLIPA